MPRLVGRQAHRPNGTTSHSTPGPEEYYRINVAIPIIDHLEAELTTRFNAENRVGCETFRLVPTSIINDNDVQGLVTKLLFWEVDIPTHHHFSQKLSNGSAIGRMQIIFQLIYIVVFS